APDFALSDVHGENQNLQKQLGKIVVLEWTNPECPFVQKHYNSNNMQDLQQKYTNLGIVWITINSSAQGQSGYMTVEQAHDFAKQYNASPSTLLLDPQGVVGKLYGAKATPHMFIIDKKGVLVYQGAIDSIRSTHADDVKKATNYVDQALTELLNNKPIRIPETKPYGCSVKYKA
ncbi:MAG TPA: redoxin domain-containing protein, partial [Gammaproteobacteria bacterium]|nr:redoxin domain-containing protein [Gammaproteobacteria bacterium]